ncbi:MAG: hypothetical protein ACOC7X_01670 [Spirochaetota bacterium]
MEHGMANLQKYLSKPTEFESNQTDQFLQLAGSWRDEREADEIIDDMDLIIGSTAFAHNLILVTNNVKQFEKIKGLQLENWSV